MNLEKKLKIKMNFYTDVFFSYKKIEYSERRVKYRQKYFRPFSPAGLFNYVRSFCGHQASIG